MTRGSGRPHGRMGFGIWMMVGVLLLGASAWAGGMSRHSGTVAAVDPAGGTLVVEEVGPWPTGNGETVTTRRTFAVTPATEFVRVSRAPGVAASGWSGDYVQSPAEPWSAAPGQHVTVEAVREDGRLRAVRVTVVAGDRS